jgi:hypothetical protein
LHAPRRSNWTVFLSLLLLPLIGVRRWRSLTKRLSVPVRIVVGMLLLAGIASPITGCSSVVVQKPESGGGNDQPTQYTLTVTASSGNVRKTATVTLRVQ